MRSYFLWVVLLYPLFASAGTHPPISFIENKNQWPGLYRFAADVQNGKILFTHNKMRFAFREPYKPGDGKDQNNIGPHANPFTESGAISTEINAHLYDVYFLNANPNTALYGDGKLSTVYNYFLGNDRSRWAANVPTYAAIYYEDIYCDIDLRYYTINGHMKYEWIVAPQINPSIITLRYDGVDKIYIDNDNLHIETSINEVWEMRPFAYQTKNGQRIEVPCRYVVKGNEVRYDFPNGYDECYELIIDPVLIFSAYSGSTLDNWGNTATYDAKGNTYSGGMVTNVSNIAGFPVTPGAYQMQYGGGNWDVGILKYDSAGSNLLYCTYLGGNDTETPQSLVVNTNNELLVLGATGSTDFPVTNNTLFKGGEFIDPLWGVPYNQGTDLFVAKLSENGSALLGATYLGGTKNDGVNFVSGAMYSNAKVESPLARNYGDQLRGDIIADQNNFVYIASNTLSHDFPVTTSDRNFKGGTHDAIAVKLKPDLSDIVWSRYIGGTGTDAAYSIKLDQTENVFVAGGTNSPAIQEVDGYLATNQGNIDGWILSFTNDGNPIHGTFLGTPQYDQAYFIDLNIQDEVFVFGQTKGSYKVVGNVYSNPGGGQFLHKLSHDLKTTEFSTVIGTGGNTPNISPTAFMISDCGYLYLSGWGGITNSPTLNVGNGNTIFRNYVGGSTQGLPITADAYQPNTTGNDFYFMVLSANASTFLYGSFLGGNQSATHVDGGTSRFDKQGIVYHAVCAGCGGNSDFPAVNVPAAHRFNGSTNCNNAVFKFDLTLLRAKLQTNSIQLDMPGLNKICLPDKIVFENLSVGGKIFEWDLGDGTRITKTDRSPIVHEYKSTRRYTVWLKAIDEGTCKARDSVSTFVDVFTADAFIQDDDDLCAGSAYTLNASGGAQYSWVSKDKSFQSTTPTPKVSPKDTTVYYVKVTESNGCIHRDTVQLNVIPLITPDFEIIRHADCTSIPSVHVKNITDSLREGDQLYFDFGDGTTTDLEEAEHKFTEDGYYTVKLVAIREFCVTEKTIPMPFLSLKIPNIITPAVADNANDKFTIQYGQEKDKTPGDFGYKVSLIIYNRWGDQIYQTDDYQYDWTGEGLSSGIYFYEVTIQDHATCKSWVHLMR